MINLATVQPHIATLKNMTEVNNHIGALRLIASILEDSRLENALAGLASLAAPQGISGHLRPIRYYLERATMDQACARMTPAAFDAVYDAL